MLGLYPHAHVWLWIILAFWEIFFSLTHASPLFVVCISFDASPLFLLFLFFFFPLLFILFISFYACHASPLFLLFFFDFFLSFVSSSYLLLRSPVTCTPD